METAVLLLSAFITSSISAVLGMGGGIILLGIMAIVIPDGYIVIALHGVIQLFSNTTRTFIFKNHIDREVLKQFLFGSLIGAAVSALIITVIIRFFQVDSANQIKVEVLKPVIGIFILWYLFIKKKGNKRSGSFLLVGGISGISSIFVGATGPLIAPFFLNRRFSKECIIANKAACQTITHLTKIPLFIYFFNFNYIEEFDLLIPLIAAVFFGTNLGKRMLGFIPEALFKKIFRFVLFLIALKLIAHNF